MLSKRPMSCLTDAQLNRLAADKAADLSLRTLREHLAQCPVCAGRFERRRSTSVSTVNRDLGRVIPPRDRSVLPSPLATASLPEFSNPTVTAVSRPVWRPTEVSIPGYEIIRELHRGGQGIVYEAVQLSANRTVAVKVMLEGTLASERSRGRFEREVKLIAHLKHPNIVVLHDSGIAQGRYYFAMDYIRGKPLDMHVRQASLSTLETIGLFLKVCSAVAYAHRRGVIHRDLKPSNILVGEDNEPQVLDFGLAKIIGDEMAEGRDLLVTQTGQLMGTLRYMSPEQTVGNPDLIDTRTDVYTLGVILYELLTGKAPYDTKTDLTAALKAIREADPPRASRIQQGVNSELEAVLFKAMHKEQDRRYQTAGEFEQDLRAWIEDRPVTARSDSAFYVLRKLAARHYFHTSVIIALIASIIAFGSISYQAYLRAEGALVQKNLSEKDMKIAFQDMTEFQSEARERIRQQALGWFLLEWHAGRTQWAKDIQTQIKDRRCSEYLAMSFLLDESLSIESFQKRLPAEAGALAHFVTGERWLKAGKTREAMAEFEAAVREAQPGYEWYVQSAAARLAHLREAVDGAGVSGSSRPAEK